jgi:hypothetical protein
MRPIRRFTGPSRCNIQHSLTLSPRPSPRSPSSDPSQFPALRSAPRPIHLDLWCALKHAMFSRMKDLSGQAPERTLTDSGRDERSSRMKQTVENS